MDVGAADAADDFVERNDALFVIGNALRLLVIILTRLALSVADMTHCVLILVQLGADYIAFNIVHADVLIDSVPRVNRVVIHADFTAVFTITYYRCKIDILPVESIDTSEHILTRYGVVFGVQHILMYIESAGQTTSR